MLSGNITSADPKKIFNLDLGDIEVQIDETNLNKLYKGLRNFFVLNYGVFDYRIKVGCLIVKEDVHGSERQMAESRHIGRTIQERGISESSCETFEPTSPHDQKVLDAVRAYYADWAAEREA